MEPNHTIPVANQTAVNTLPRHRRPLAHLADVQRALLECRARVVAAASIAGGRLDRSLVAEAVGEIDELMGVVADLSAAAAQVARDVGAERELAARARLAERAAAAAGRDGGDR